MRRNQWLASVGIAGWNGSESPAALRRNTQLANHSNVVHSSAAGRFQFTQTTLRQMREQYGLAGSLMFNEEMQDRLAAMRIAQEPGGLNATGLSHIWASLPDPNTGTSYYGQHTGASVGEVQQAINGANRVAPIQRYGLPMHDDPTSWPTAPAVTPVPMTSVGSPGAAGPNGQATVRLTFENPPPGLRGSTVSQGGVHVEMPTLGNTP